MEMQLKPDQAPLSVHEVTRIAVLQIEHWSTTGSLERERAQKRPSNIGQLVRDASTSWGTLFFEKQCPFVAKSEERRKCFLLPSVIVRRVF